MPGKDPAGLILNSGDAATTLVKKWGENAR